MIVVDLDDLAQANLFIRLSSHNASETREQLTLRRAAPLALYEAYLLDVATIGNQSASQRAPQTERKRVAEYCDCLAAK